MVTPMNWVGTYNDNNYGGYINVCVSLVNGVYYGQAAFSEVGYMRGTIDVTTLTWSGNFFTSGLEVKQGTFSLLLDTSGTPYSFTGTFTENPGITYTATSTQLSTVTPTDLACMKSEDYLLTTTDFYNFNRVWYEPILDLTSSMYVNQTLEQVTGSYYYHFDGVLHHGFQYHQPLFTLNGQVTSGNWYEGEGFLGMEMYVAKNSTTAYATYWAFATMADFDFNAQLSDPFLHAQSYTYLKPDDGTPTYTEAAVNTCYMTPTWKTFNWCETGFANMNVSHNDDITNSADSNSSDSLSDGQTAGIVIGVLVALAIGAVVGFFVGKRSASAPMASKEESKPASEMASRA